MAFHKPPIVPTKTGWSSRFFQCLEKEAKTFPNIGKVSCPARPFLLKIQHTSGLCGNLILPNTGILVGRNVSA